MELEHSFTIPIPPEQAWHALLDVEQVAPCMPGASVESVEGEVINGRIKVKVGPVMLTYTGTARFTQRDDQARSVTLEASGREARGGGTASAVIRSSLLDEGGQTRVTVNTSLTVTGRPAQFGQGVMADVGGRIIGKFASNLAAQLAGGQVGAPAAGAGAAPAPAAQAGPASVDEAVRGLPIDELALPTRAYNSLRREGVLTIGNLCDSTEARLLAIEHIGPQAIKEIRQKLGERGLSLAEPADQGAKAAADEAAVGAQPGAGAQPGGAGQPGGAAAQPPGPTGAPVSRPPQPPEEEALDLLDVAAFPVLKRALPALGATAAVVLASWWTRRRWRRVHSGH